MLLKTVDAQSFPAIVFNNTLSGILDTVQQLNVQWGKQLKVAIAEEDFASLKPFHTALSAYLDSSVKKVRQMKNYRNSAPLKDALLQYLHTMKRLTDQYYTQIEEIGNKPERDEDDETEDVDVRVLLNRLKKEPSIQIAEENLHAAQERYAKENGQEIK